MVGLMPGADGQAVVIHGAFTNPGKPEKKSKRWTVAPSLVLAGLEEASRQRVLSARPAVEPYSGRTLAPLAVLLGAQAGKFVSSQAAGDSENSVAGSRNRSGEDAEKAPKEGSQGAFQ